MCSGWDTNPHPLGGIPSALLLKLPGLLTRWRRHACRRRPHGRVDHEAQRHLTNALSTVSQSVSTVSQSVSTVSQSVSTMTRSSHATKQMSAWPVAAACACDSGFRDCDPGSRDCDPGSRDCDSGCRQVLRRATANRADARAGQSRLLHRHPPARRARAAVRPASRAPRAPPTRTCSSQTGEAAVEEIPRQIGHMLWHLWLAYGEGRMDATVLRCAPLAPRQRGAPDPSKIGAMESVALHS
jgi:hypothetical protein